MELEVAIPSPLGQTFTYFHEVPVPIGARVRVLFARQGKTIGVVLNCSPDQESSSRTFKLKPIVDVVDEDAIYSDTMLQLAKWMSNYYMHPIGEVLRTMLPASKAKSSKFTFERIDSDASEETLTLLNKIFGRKTKLSSTTLHSKLKSFEPDSKARQKQIDKWISQGFIKLTADVDFKTRFSKAKNAAEVSNTKEEPSNTSVSKNLNQSQQAAVDAIVKEGIHQTPKTPFLVFGVTGSGKTEVFMNVLQELLKTDSSAQALVLVPEISLTPQTTRIFQDRFSGKVAVVHSAMNDQDRWDELNRIRSGDANILIGPRSAVFGPFKNLKLIIVDEEHDSSYKQGTGLLYNARDIAVVRGKMEQAAVVLGSATPSMESWHNALTQKYKILELPERATKRSLPEVTTILAKPSYKAIQRVRAGNLELPEDEKPESIFTDEVVNALKQNLADGHQSIVLVNRRGYAYYLINLQDGKTAQCPQCSISLSVHSKRKVLRCHYCDYQTSVQKIIDESKIDTWAIVGYGSQKAEEALKLHMPTARIARLDSDTVVDPKALPETLAKFRNRELDILVGTQILAKGHDFPNVTLICILEVDQLLSLPDFRGGERTFQLLVQAAGRAGRGELSGKVLVQSMRVDHPIVQEALRQDFVSFANNEIKFRQAMGYPPFGKMTLFEFNGTDRHQLNDWCNKLEDRLDSLLSENPSLVPYVKILGPAPAPIEVVRGRTRKTIIVLTNNHQNTRTVSNWILQECKKPPGDIRVKVDVDPQSTL